MPTPPANDRGLTFLLEEYFSASDDRFLETLRQITSLKYLATFADRWKKDPRPWARAQIIAYIQLPLNRPGHHPVVKRLFKQAEQNRDDELMAYFLVAFDRLVRRKLVVRGRWDRPSRTMIQDEVLVTPRNRIPSGDGRSYKNPATGEDIFVRYRMPERPDFRLFSYRTRYYLRRRAWRYFRRLAFQRSAEYANAIARALIQYRDEDLASGENILDSWSLMQACFRRCDALEFKPGHVVLRDGRNLSEMAPSPFRADAWKDGAAANILFSLICNAQSRLVRVWAMGFLRREHPGWLPAQDDLLRLLDHQDSEIQQFGAAQLASFPGLEKTPVSFWLRLLQVQDPAVLQAICDTFVKNVTAARLDLTQSVELAAAKPAPVARVGLQFLQQRTFANLSDRTALLKLSEARCAAIGRDLGKWLLGIIGTRENYQADQVVWLFDSLLPELRLAAWDWLIADSAGYNDPVLWSRLIETPFDDLRLRIVDHLERRTKIPGAASGQLAPLWCSVLLGVHRGGRQKAKAVRQLGEALQRDPATIDSLVPVLTAAIRSVRRPEARAGVAAIVAAVEAVPALSDAVKRNLPELNLSPAGAAR